MGSIINTMYNTEVSSVEKDSLSVNIRFFQFGTIIKLLFMCRFLCETGFLGKILGVGSWVVW